MFKEFDPKNSGLSEKDIKAIRSCLKNFKEIEQVILYGSRAKGNYRNGSDIDLSLIGPTLEPSILLKLGNDLDDLMLPYSFDISIYSKIENPDFKEHIDRVGVLFFQSKKN